MTLKTTRIALSLTICLFLSAYSLSAQQVPEATQHLAPLIGSWSMKQSNMTPQGNWVDVPGKPTWTFEWGLGGHALYDYWESKYLDKASNDSLPSYGINIRIYDPKAEKWNVAWTETISRSFANFEGTSTPEEFKMEGKNVSGRYVKIRFYDFEPNSFKWEQAWSFDGEKTWVVIARMIGTRVN